MDMIDEKIVSLNDGEKDIKVRVYLKEVPVKNNNSSKRVFARVI